MSVERQTGRSSPPLSSQGASWVVNGSRESSVSTSKKLPTLDEIRSIRKRAKMTFDTKSLPPFMPPVLRKPSSDSLVAASRQSISQMSTKEDGSLAASVLSDGPHTSGPPLPPLVTMGTGMGEKGGLSSPIPVDHRNAESFPTHEAPAAKILVSPAIDVVVPTAPTDTPIVVPCDSPPDKSKSMDATVPVSDVSSDNTTLLTAHTRLLWNPFYRTQMMQNHWRISFILTIASFSRTTALLQQIFRPRLLVISPNPKSLHHSSVLL